MLALCAGLLVQRGRGSAPVLRLGELTATPAEVVSGGRTRLSCVVESSAGAPRFAWSVGGGTLVGTGTEATWIAPAMPGRYRVDLLVVDDLTSTTASVVIDVRLPSPRGRSGRLVERSSALSASASSSVRADDKRAELRRMIAADLHRDSPFARDEWINHMSELADAALFAGEAEEALIAYGLLLQVHPADQLGMTFRAGYGKAALLLGRDDEALRALLDAGPFNDGPGFYCLGALLEAQGRMEPAVRAYANAVRNAPTLADAVFRSALLRWESGDAVSAIDSLVQSSPHLGGDRMLRRLHDDPELEPLLHALRSAGRVDELEAQRPVHTSERQGQLHQPVEVGR
jgi:hypothetical protein